MTFHLARLGEIADFDRQGIDPARIESGARYVGLEHIDDSGAVHEVTVNNGELASTKFAFTPDHILYGKLRPYLRKIARPDFGGICSTDIIPIKPSLRVNRDYLFHFLRLDEIVAKAASLATGVNLPRVSPRILEEFDVPLPSLDAQRRIAGILDQAEGLRRKRLESLHRLSSISQILFASMFGDWSRPGFNGSLVSLADRLDFLTSGSRGWARHYRDRGSLFLRIQNVKRDQLDLSDVVFVDAPGTAEAQRTRVQEGDVLLSITADLGRTAVVPAGIGEAFINQHLAILRTSKLEPRFLSAALTSRAGQNAIQSKNREGVKAGLNFEDVRSLMIPDVDLRVQREFALRASAIDALMQHYRAHLAKLDALFASLQHRAFRGEL
ncbi:MAG TPA: restriction endonuclease subunit S [Xanthobacteraceae bacterium]|nr:restriction endonuclease subunit S [Xanthobacteraceae bacterium]